MPKLGASDDLLPADAPGDLHRFVDYWIAKAAGRAMPAFADIDPVEIPWALSRVYVVRVVDGGSDFVYRLAGEAINDRHGTSLAGKRPGDLFPPALTRQVLDRWQRLISEPAACCTESDHPTNAGRWIRARRVLLPLGAAAGPADHVLGMTIFEAPGTAFATFGEAGMLKARWVRLRGGV